jgi:putative ABC transport system permease protein
VYFLKRAGIYVTRKKSKVITMGVILFIVSALVLTGLLIKSAAQKTFDAARSKLGATVSYTTDLSSVMGNPKERIPGSGMGITLPDDYTSITTKEIETIYEDSNYVESYVINASLAGTAIDFSYYNPSGSATEENDDRPSGTSASINIVGVSNLSNDTIFNIDANTLVDGRYFTDEEITNATNVVILEQTIATLNDLSVGDTITIERQNRRMPGETTSVETAVEITYQIVGIYKTSNPTDISNSSFAGSFNLVENTMYSPYTTVLSASLAGLEGDALTEAKISIEENGYQVNSVTFTLDDPANIDAFIAEVKAMNNIDTTYRSLSANDAAYEKMVGSIENVASTSTVLVVVVVIAGALIIGLLSMLSIKDRRYEIGVLLALGESRAKIVGQLIAEIVIVAVVSYSLSTVVSNLTAQVTTNYLLNKELAAQTTDNDQQSLGMFGGRDRFAQQSLLNVETIDSLTVSINAEDITKMFAIGMAIAIVGSMTQALFVLRLNPKEILLER